MKMPMIYNPRINGLEDERELTLIPGSVIAGRFSMVKLVGKGSFSAFYKCTDQGSVNHPLVGVKIVKNDKDCFDTGCAEIRVLSLIRQRNGGEHHLLRMFGFMYWREHIIIVTELLQESLYKCYRSFGTDDARLRFFSKRTIAALSYQMLDALAFLHNFGVAHCDVKAENICLSPTRTCHFTLIDFGSAVLTYDVHNSYVQSRWYRAPEVMLGVPWNTKVDMWSLGCVLPEVLIGQPIFRRESVEGVLATHIAVLGPMPQYMMQHTAELADMFFADNGLPYQIDPPGMRKGAYILQPLPNKKLPHLLADIMKPDLFGGEIDGFVDHVCKLLTIDPHHRPTATAASQHPWLVGEMASLDVVTESPPAPRSSAYGKDMMGCSVPSITRTASPASSSSDATSLMSSFKSVARSASSPGTSPQSCKRSGSKLSGSFKQPAVHWGACPDQPPVKSAVRSPPCSPTSGLASNGANPHHSPMAAAFSMGSRRSDDENMLPSASQVRSNFHRSANASMLAQDLWLTRGARAFQPAIKP